MCENNHPHLKSWSIDHAKFLVVTMPTEIRFICESVIILKNWLKILLRLIHEGDLYSNIYGMYRECSTKKNEIQFLMTEWMDGPLMKQSFNFSFVIVIHIQRSKPESKEAC